MPANISPAGAFNWKNEQQAKYRAITDLIQHNINSIISTKQP